MNRPQPILKWAVVVGAVNMLVAMLVSFGVLDWSPEQLDSIDKFLIAAGAVIVPVAPMWWPLLQVTPLSDPQDNMGIALIPDPDA